jgi:hypothetical protein
MKASAEANTIALLTQRQLRRQQTMDFENSKKEQLRNRQRVTQSVVDHRNAGGAKVPISEPMKFRVVEEPVLPKIPLSRFQSEFEEPELPKPDLYYERTNHRQSSLDEPEKFTPFREPEIPSPHEIPEITPLEDYLPELPADSWQPTDADWQEYEQAFGHYDEVGPSEEEGETGQRGGQYGEEYDDTPKFEPDYPPAIDDYQGFNLDYPPEVYQEEYEEYYEEIPTEPLKDYKATERPEDQWSSWDPELGPPPELNFNFELPVPITPVSPRSPVKSEPQPEPTTEHSLESELLLLQRQLQFLAVDSEPNTPTPTPTLTSTPNIAPTPAPAPPLEWNDNQLSAFDMQLAELDELLEAHKAGQEIKMESRASTTVRYTPETGPSPSADEGPKYSYSYDIYDLPELTEEAVLEAFEDSQEPTPALKPIDTFQIYSPYLTTDLASTCLQKIQFEKLNLATLPENIDLFIRYDTSLFVLTIQFLW